METKVEKNFKAVEFMRQVREEMSALYYRDKEQYRNQAKQAMADFLARRKEAASSEGVNTPSPS